MRSTIQQPVSHSLLPGKELISLHLWREKFQHQVITHNYLHTERNGINRFTKLYLSKLMIDAFDNMTQQVDTASKSPDIFYTIHDNTCAELILLRIAYHLADTVPNRAFSSFICKARHTPERVRRTGKEVVTNIINQTPFATYSSLPYAQTRLCIESFFSKAVSRELSLQQFSWVQFNLDTLNTQITKHLSVETDMAYSIMEKQVNYRSLFLAALVTLMEKVPIKADLIKIRTLLIASFNLIDIDSIPLSIFNHTR